MKKMHYLVFYFTVFLFIQNTRSDKTKLYIIKLANNADQIEISELHKLLTKSKEQLVNANLGKDNKAINFKDCINDQTTTYLEKIECLQNINRNKSDKKIRNFAKHREFYNQRPKRKISSLFNYGREIRKPKPITDITRQTFSQDYLDISDLSRLETKCFHASCQDRSNYEIEKKGYRVNRRNIRDSDQSDTSKSDDESSSTEDDSKSTEDNVRTYKKHKPKRFKVIFNEDSSIESDLNKISSESDSESKSKSDTEVTEKPKTLNEKEAYLQGNRIYKNIRRRLEHFLPKRYHWDEEDMRNLGYYWYDGPRGKYT